MLEDPLLLSLLVAGIVFFAGMIQGALGFGYALAALTTLPFLVAPQSAHIILSLSGIPVLAMAAWTSREGADWATIRRALFAAALFVPLGLLTFGALSADGLIRGTGLAILTLMLFDLIKKPKTDSSGSGNQWYNSASMAGAISGYLAGAVSIGGPPIVAYAVRQDWSPLKSKAFMTRCLLLTACFKGVGLFVGQFVTTPIAIQALLAMPSAIGGVWVGARLGRHIPAQAYKRVIAAILVAISCWWVINGSGEKPSPTADLPQTTRFV